MSIEAQEYVWGIPMEAPLKLVAIALAWHANKDGTNAFPSKATLMDLTGYRERTVQRHLARLVELDIVQVQKPAGGHRPTTYRFPLDRGEPSVAPLAMLQGGQMRPRGAKSGIQGGHSCGPLTVEPSYEKDQSTSSAPPVDISVVRRRNDEALPGLAAYRIARRSSTRRTT
jgi:hypothetical protein